MLEIGTKVILNMHFGDMETFLIRKGSMGFVRVNDFATDEVTVEFVEQMSVTVPLFLLDETDSAINYKSQYAKPLL